MSTEKYHSPDNGMETGENASIGSVVVVAISAGVGSTVGAAL